MNKTDFSSHFKGFFSGTLISRMSGLLRDLCATFYFGDHPSLAAFLVAFRFTNLFRRLLGEGPFQSAFIPHFESLRVNDKQQATHFFRQLSLFFVVILLVVIVLGEGFLFCSRSFLSLSADTQEIIVMSQWLLPGILFICLYGLNISLLQCNNSFFISSIAPLASNTVWIATILLMRHQPPASAMLTLSKWMVFGFCGQWLLTLPLTLKNVASSFKEWFHWRIPPEIKRLAKAYSFGLIGVGAVQINSLADSLFARSVNLRGPVYLWNSIRLNQVVLAVLCLALTSTVIPNLSRKIKEGRLYEAQNLLILASRRIVTLILPCSIACLVLGVGAVNLIFGRGCFSAIAVSQTTLCLWAYGLGLVPATLVILFGSIFFAQNDFRTPMRFTVVTVGLNLCLNAFFVYVLNLESTSIALATTLSSWINYWILHRLISRDVCKMPYLKSYSVILACVFAFSVSLVVDGTLFDFACLRPLLKGPHYYATGGIHQAFYFTTLFLTFFVSILFYALLTKNKDLLNFTKELLWKKDKKTKDLIS